MRWLVFVAIAACGTREADPPPPSPPRRVVVVDAAVPRGPQPVAIGMSFRSALALLDDGTVRAWGNGQFGLLGRGKGADAATPVVVPGVRDAVALVVSSNTPLACAHLRSGAWTCWGKGDYLPSAKPEVRAPAIEPMLDRMRLVRFGAWFGCGIRDDGHVACWGNVPPRDPALPGTPLAEIPGLHDAVAMSISSNICVVEADGSVWCWGKDNYGQTSATTDQPAEDRVVAKPRRVPDIADAIDVALGVETSCVRRRSGDLACWGRTFGLRGVVRVPSKADSHLIDADRLDICEASATGAVRCLAWMGSKDCNGARTVEAINRCLSTEQTYRGGDAWHPLPIEPARSLATDYDSDCALSLDGEVRCWGKNDVGQLGDGTLVSRDLAKPVVSLVDVAAPVPPPTPPPSPDARGTLWGGRPADCAYDETLDFAHVSVRGPFVVRAAFARRGDLVDIELHDHLVDPRDVGHVPKLVADQRSVRLTLSNETAKGDFVAVTPGRYTVAAKQRDHAAAMVVEDPHTYADAFADPTRMTGSVVVTHLDAGWVCGRIDVSGPGGHIRGRFAAEVPK